MRLIITAPGALPTRAGAQQEYVQHHDQIEID